MDIENYRSIKEDQKRLADAQDEIKKEVTDIRDRLFKNGLVQQVHDNTSKVTEQSKWIDRATKLFVWAFGTMFLGVIATIANAVIFLLSKVH